MMKLPLVKGAEREDRISLLISFHPKFSQSTKDALIEYLTGWQDETAVCNHYGLKVSNFERSLATLNETNHKVEQIKAIDLAHLSDKSEVSKTASSFKSIMEACHARGVLS